MPTNYNRKLKYFQSKSGNCFMRRCYYNGARYRWDGVRRMATRIKTTRCSRYQGPRAFDQTSLAR